MQQAKCLTQTEVGRYLRSSRWTVRRLIAAGRLPADREITTADVAALIARSAYPRSEEVVPEPKIEPLYTLAEVAMMSRLSLRSLQDGARHKPPRFRHRHINGRRFMTQEDYDLFMASVVEDPGNPAADEDREVAAELDRRASRGRRSGRAA